MHCFVCGNQIEVKKYGEIAYCLWCAFWYDIEDFKMVLQSVDIIRIFKDLDKKDKKENEKKKIKVKENDEEQEGINIKND